MGVMDISDSDSFSIECGTCVATGTTACTDCVVAHLLANDDGPIDFVPVALGAASRAAPGTEQERAWARAVALFERAGLLDDPVQFVPLAEFEGPLSVAAAGVP
jgi:hypothetical protein